LFKVFKLHLKFSEIKSELSIIQNTSLQRSLRITLSVWQNRRSQSRSRVWRS